MRVILTGATGFVGTEILSQILQHPQVKAVTCLLRRPVAVESPKLKTILLSDFTQFDDGLAQELAQHSACIWALGGKASDVGTAEEFIRVTYTFTLNFAQAVSMHLIRPFRFCYLSGMGADPTETATFPWERPTRHIKGRVERDLAALSGRVPFFHATAFRPGGILPVTSGALATALLAPIALRVDQLARAMIGEAVNEGGAPCRVLSNQAIKGQATSLLTPS